LTRYSRWKKEKLQAKIKLYRYTGCRKTVKDRKAAD
jgi:hypothetical protein